MHCLYITPNITLSWSLQTRRLCVCHHCKVTLFKTFSGRELTPHIFWKHLSISCSTSRRAACGQNILLQVKLFRSSAEYTVNRTVHRKLLGEHTVFVNSEISKRYSVPCDGLTRFKYRTTHVHKRCDDSTLALHKAGQQCVSSL